MDSRTDLRNAPSVDRAVLAVTQLHMRWEASGLGVVTDEMISETASSWAVSDTEEHEIATFLAEFVLDMRNEDEDGTSGEYEEDNTY